MKMRLELMQTMERVSMMSRWHLEKDHLEKEKEQQQFQREYFLFWTSMASC